jgi:hypothetical protein
VCEFDAPALAQDDDVIGVEREAFGGMHIPQIGPPHLRHQNVGRRHLVPNLRADVRL